MAGIFIADDTPPGHQGQHFDISESVFTPASSKGLFRAIKDANFTQARLLVNAGTDVNLRGERGETALAAALQVQDSTKRAGLVRWLIRSQASVSAVDRSTGRDAILWAAYLNHTPELLVALEAGLSDCHINRRDNLGYTALHYSVFHDNVHAVRIIANLHRQFGLSLDCPDQHEVTPYLHALRLGHEQCAQLLKPRQAQSRAALDGDTVWGRIGELQGIRLARSKQHSPHRRLPSAVTLPVPRPQRAPLPRTGHADTNRPANRVRGQPHDDRTRARRGTLTSSSMERGRIAESARAVTFTRLENVSVNMADLQPEVSPRLRSKAKRPWASVDVLPDLDGSSLSRLTTHSAGNDRKKHEYRSFIPQLFAMYAEQQTGSVLPAARAPAPSISAVVNATKFAMMLRNRQKQRVNDTTADSRTKKAANSK